MNSVGHVIFEVPLVGESASALEMFQLKNGDVYTVMVRDRLVTIYNGYVSTGSFLIQDSIEDSQTFLPLEIIYNSVTDQLMLLANGGQSSDKTTLAAFSIDYKTSESSLISTFQVASFTST